MCTPDTRRPVLPTFRLAVSGSARPSSQVKLQLSSAALSGINVKKGRPGARTVKSLRKNCRCFCQHKSKLLLGHYPDIVVAGNSIKLVVKLSAS